MIFNDDTVYPYLWTIENNRYYREVESPSLDESMIDVDCEESRPGTCQHYGIEPCECDQGIV